MNTNEFTPLTSWELLDGITVEDGYDPQIAWTTEDTIVHRNIDLNPWGAFERYPEAAPEPTRRSLLALVAAVLR